MNHYEPFDKITATATDRVAWALCQIIDDDAPMRWTRYRFAAECIALNFDVMRDLQDIKEARMREKNEQLRKHMSEIYSLREAEESLREENERLRELLEEAGKDAWLNHNGDLVDRIEAALRREQQTS